MPPLQMVKTSLHLVALLSFAAATPLALRGTEARIAVLKGLENREVQQAGFSLAAATKVHVHARGGGINTVSFSSREEPLFAQGWILNAITREVVWQMDRHTAKRDGDYWVAERDLELPAGPYEAYFANHGFGQSLLFAQWSSNIDRRKLRSEGVEDSRLLRQWREQVPGYGMEITLVGSPATPVAAFEPPLRWKSIVITLPATHDDGHWTQTFQLKQPASLHLYAMGEGSGRVMHDYGWITDAHTRKRVWEMRMDTSNYAGGAAKNRRQVETIKLPAGDYEATFVTDDSHSPADWNATPPCDPNNYGLTISLSTEADLGNFALMTPKQPEVVAALVRIANDQDRIAPFTLTEARALRVYAIAEGDAGDMADAAWIEDSEGRRVWEMKRHRTYHAGGANKNRLSDELINLPKGSYLLRFRTDDSHAFGSWNSDPPRDPEHYGITLYAGN